MFVVTGLHSKRRPCIGVVKFTTTIRKRSIEKSSSPVTLSRAKRSANNSAPPSAMPAPRVFGARMTRHRNESVAFNPNCKDGHTIKVAFGQVDPPRVRKFIPKPLILVERMKARQLFCETLPPDVSKPRIVSKLGVRSEARVTTPVSTHATPPSRRLTCGTLSSDSSNISFLLSPQNSAGFGMMHRMVRPLSSVTMGDTSASTDTFVADSPCCAKRASSKLPLLVTTTNTSQASPDVKSYSEDHDAAALSDFVDFVHPSYLSDVFEPRTTSTPLSLPSNRAESHEDPLPTAFIASPTSRVMYRFDSATNSYVVKLPNSGGATSISRRTCPLCSSGTTASQAMLTESGSHGLTRCTTTSPRLIFDGVFAVRRPSPPPSPPPRSTLDGGFARPRKPTLCQRPLYNTTNAPTSASPHQTQATSPPSPRRRSNAEVASSPRSKLAHVLTTHTPGPAWSEPPQTQTAMTLGGREHTRTLVPPLAQSGPRRSNDLQTQRHEIEASRVRRVVGLGRDAGADSGIVGDGGDVGAAKGAYERVSLVRMGVVAKLRAQWEAGNLNAAR